ncbi:MAG: adenylyltransferase/cytidyltransferase family protein [Thermoproteota archaeon]
MANDEKRVMVAGSFEILHPGHVYLLKEAKKLGRVIVVVSSDYNFERFKKRKPIIGENQRLEMVRSLKFVDEAIIGNPIDNIFEIILKIRPDILLLGPDQHINEEELKNFLRNNGLNTEIRRLSKRLEGELYSSSKIIEKIIKTFGNKGNMGP